MSATMSSSHETPDPHFEVLALGGRGDGLVETADGRIHVAGVLAGEVIAIEPPRTKRASHARLKAVVKPSAERVEPVCVHFGTCGGCSLQHWLEEPYRAWKANLVNRALGSAFKDSPALSSIPETKTAIAAWGAGRRRAILHGQVKDGQVSLGYMAARTDTLIDITMCPVLVPEIEAALPALRDLVYGLAPNGPALDLAVTATAEGLDVSVSASETGRKLHLPEPRKLARLVDDSGIARLSFDRLSAISSRQPTVTMAGMAVSIPPAAFLQATAAGEAALVDQVMAWAKGATRIADLFCGVGTFTLPLRTIAPVMGWEVDAPAVQAINTAVARAGGGHKLVAQQRDLYRSPVAPAEMEGVDTVVLDPPRAGATAQIAQLARMSLKRIIYVSCDPVSFARDASTLVAAGYRLKAVQAFDQFRWSSHVELVACFDGPAPGAASIATGAIKPLPSIRRPGQGRRGGRG
jgi:23S rRNA (uracil1939-C5)-methyltransferase